MKLRYIIQLLILSLLTVSCNLEKITELLKLYNDAKSHSQRDAQNKEKITFEEASQQLDLYWAITTKDVDKVREYLEKGYDPNRCRGEEGWMVGTPLNVMVRGSYDTYLRLIRGEEIPDPPIDIAMFQMLVDAGADVNQRPYIWCRVNLYDNFLLKLRLENEQLRLNWKTPQTKEEAEELKKENLEAALYYVHDTNRLIEAFLKAGADPDKRGHPYPYSLEAKRKRITDEEADKYFAKGTRPINEAIKKGIRWESQVDLLLQYTTLDKDSLKAARESKDPAMLAKITRLWNEQNAGR